MEELKEKIDKYKKFSTNMIAWFKRETVETI